MISHAQIADLLVKLYAGADGFDYYNTGADTGVCWALAKFPDEYVFCFRGSATPEDWAVDLMAVSPIEHPTFGRVHPGFLLGMEQTCTAILAMMERPGRGITLAGHSLGAARAAIATAILRERSQPISRRVVFGEPKPGMQAFSDYIAGVEATSYRTVDPVEHRHDQVTDLPYTIPLQWYVHPKPLTNLMCDSADHSLFGLHHLPLYVQALAARP